MSLSMISRVLYWRWRLRRREHWSRRELDAYQHEALRKLRAFAIERSAFYRRYYAGLEGRPLAELPVLTKQQLMAHFDEISTDPAVRLDAVESYLQKTEDGKRFAERYWISGTSGSSGQRALIASDAREWAVVIASYARAQEWAGVRPSLRRKTRMAVVSSTTAWHQSARVGATVESGIVQTLRLDAGEPLGDITRALDLFRPEVLVAYASMVRALAEEQLAETLHIEPRAVCSSSEVLTEETRALAQRAWGVPPFNVYAATETGGIAAECERHALHLFEDLVISEVVDDVGRPVPAGGSGDRLLVTVLSTRTLPLIRYELTDRVRLSTCACACGRPFAAMAAVEGRTDDLIELPGADGTNRRLHPVVFHRLLDLVPAGGWQVRQEGSALRVLVAKPQRQVDVRALETSIRDAVASAGVVRPSVTVEVVERIAAAASGKRPLIVASRPDGKRS